MKLFTLEEANALLPTIRRLFAKVDAERQRLRQLEPEARLASERATENGGTHYGAAYVNTLLLFIEAAQNILSLGVEIKDFERGLCDFPHMREGRVVYLCWQRGEESIEWWHDTDAGFAGRRPL